MVWEIYNIVNYLITFFILHSINNIDLEIQEQGSEPHRKQVCEVSHVEGPLQCKSYKTLLKLTFYLYRF